MEKIYCFKCNYYRKYKNFKISYFLGKEKVLSIICDKCGSNVEKIFQEEESISISILLIHSVGTNTYKNWNYKIKLIKIFCR